jgi:alanine dehydrogenase
VRELGHHGDRVIVESGAGAAIGFDDASSRAAGAEIRDRAAEAFAAAEMIVEVKEPQPHEIAALRPDQILFHPSGSGARSGAAADAGGAGLGRMRKLPETSRSAKFHL